MAGKKLNAADMLQSANTSAAREILEEAAQESTEASEPVKRRARAQKTAEPRPAGRPKSDRVCKLNITLTEEDKDYLRRLAFERTSGRQIVTISDIIAEYIEADRKKKQRAKK